MRRWTVTLLVWLMSLTIVRVGYADVLCRWFGHCVYESPGFKIRVVDKETGKPLAGVHALAEWTQYEFQGSGALLVAQDAVSGQDGMLVFPPWGPINGSSGGLVLNQDPVITLYKSGYDVMLINNAPGTDERARVRGLTQNGQTFKLGLFRGSADERVKQLGAVSDGLAGRSDTTSMQFRQPYLNRARRVWAEKDNLPKQYQNPGQFFWHVQRAINFLEEGKR
jgi:hypothetical protein